MNPDANHTIDVDPTATPDLGVDGNERRATVLQVLPALGEQGGVERGTVEVAGAIVAAGGRAIVASAGGVRVHALERVGAEHVTLPVDSKNPGTMYANIGRLTDLIRRENVDIVHARSRAPAWSAWVAAKRTRRHFVTTFHGTYGASNVLKRRYNAVMGRGERVIAISRFIAGHVNQAYGVPAGCIRVIHRGVDQEMFDPARVSADRIIMLARKWRLDEGLPVVMLPGRLTRWKGQMVFLEAIAKLGREDIRCVLLGSDQGREDYRRQLETFIAHAGLGGRRRINNHCDDMPVAYMLSDVVVSASTDPEAFGRVLVEAQALGRPVIGTDHGGARETVIPQQTGWLTPPGDAQALAAAMSTALALPPDHRGRIADAAVTNARENFSKTAMCTKTLAVYDEVLHARTRG